MKFIEEIEPKVFLLKLAIKPNSKRQQIVENSFNEEYLSIHLRSKPIQNRANRELLSFLKKKFRPQLISIELSSGAKSSTKIIKLVLENSISKQKVVELLKK